MSTSFKVTKTKDDIRALCEIYSHSLPWLKSYRTIGSPKIRFKGEYPDITEAGWLWPIQVVDTDNVYAKTCFYYDEFKHTARFWDTDPDDEWNKRLEPFFATFPGKKEITFFPAPPAEVEIKYYGSNGSTPDSEGMRQIFENLLPRYGVEVMNKPDFDCRIQNVFPVVFDGAPAFEAVTECGGDKISFLLYAGLFGYDIEPTSPILRILSAQEAALLSEPRNSQIYLMSEKVTQTQVTQGEKYIFPLLFNGKCFSQINLAHARLESVYY